jgi:hypothetical protein
MLPKSYDEGARPACDWLIAFWVSVGRPAASHASIPGFKFALVASNR